MIVHKKEVGINSETTPNQMMMAGGEKKKKKERVLDDEGFEMIK